MSWDCLDCTRRGADPELGMQHHLMTQHRVRPVPLYDQITDDEAAKMADALSLADGVEDALLAAEATARQGGEEELGEVLARVHMLWSIGGIADVRSRLDRARDHVLTGLRDSTDS